MMCFSKLKAEMVQFKIIGLTARSIYSRGMLRAIRDIEMLHAMRDIEVLRMMRDISSMYFSVN